METEGRSLGPSWAQTSLAESHGPQVLFHHLEALRPRTGSFCPQPGTDPVDVETQAKRWWQATGWSWHCHPEAPIL